MGFFPSPKQCIAKLFRFCSILFAMQDVVHNHFTSHSGAESLTACCPLTLYLMPLHGNTSVMLPSHFPPSVEHFPESPWFLGFSSFLCSLVLACARDCHAGPWFTIPSAAYVVPCRLPPLLPSALPAIFCFAGESMTKKSIAVAKSQGRLRKETLLKENWTM